MRSRTPKVLHPLAGRTLLGHVLTAVAQGNGNASVAVVTGPGHDAVALEARQFVPAARIFVQEQRRGTAHAVLAAREALSPSIDDVIIVFGDTPLILPSTIARLRAALAEGAGVAVLGFAAADPTGYGRLIIEAGRLLEIREDGAAPVVGAGPCLCNSGLMGLGGHTALEILEAIRDGNSKREFYLTDAVTIANRMGLPTVALEADEDEVRGINTRLQLAEAEAIIQQRLRLAALQAGVTLVAPQTVFLSADTVLGSDVLIEPHVVIGPKVVVGNKAVIHAFSHLEGAHIGGGASIGPFARLGPGTRVGEKARIGNFAELKPALIDAGGKANHLDACGSDRANLGAGTLTRNHDGVAKHRSVIGADAFIGSNSTLVAPASIGEAADGQDVPADALAVARGLKVNKPGWAGRLRQAVMGKKRRPD